jgi:ATP-dependent Clp protease ATP-binding subunit ClpA
MSNVQLTASSYSDDFKAIMQQSFALASHLKSKCITSAHLLVNVFENSSTVESLRDVIPNYKECAAKAMEKATEYGTSTELSVEDNKVPAQSIVLSNEAEKVVLKTQESGSILGRVDLHQLMIGILLSPDSHAYAVLKENADILALRKFYSV